MDIEEPKSESERGSDAAKAIAGAFALVAFSDGVLAHEETRRFWEEAQSRAALASVPMEQIERDFSAAIAMASEDFNAAKETIFQQIAAVRTDRIAVGAVIGFARIALAADEELKPQEETMLAEIATVLGLDPKSV